MKYALLDNASLREANLKYAKLEKARLLGASLGQARLQGAILRNAQLQGANLKKADLREADLTGARLDGVDLSGAMIHYNYYGTPASWEVAWPPVLGYRSDKSDVPSEEWTEAADPKKWGSLKWRSFINELKKFSPENFSIPNLYLDKLTRWTIKFACENKYTAQRSWSRWNDYEPLTDMEKLVAGSDQRKKVILGMIYKLANEQSHEKCAGLYDISQNQRTQSRWRREFIEFTKITSQESVMPTSVLDAHPPTSQPTKEKLLTPCRGDEPVSKSREQDAEWT